MHAALLFAAAATALRPAPPARRATRLSSYTINQLEVASPLEPLSNYMLVKVDATAETSGGGIVLTGSAKEPASTGDVLAVGPGRADPYSGAALPVQCAVGDRVMWGRYSGADVDYCGGGHTLLKDRDVMRRRGRFFFYVWSQSKRVLA